MLTRCATTLTLVAGLLTVGRCLSLADENDPTGVIGQHGPNFMKIVRVFEEFAADPSKSPADRLSIKVLEDFRDQEYGIKLLPTHVRQLQPKGLSRAMAELLIAPLTRPDEDSNAQEILNNMIIHYADIRRQCVEHKVVGKAVIPSNTFLYKLIIAATSRKVENVDYDYFSKSMKEMDRYRKTFWQILLTEDVYANMKKLREIGDIYNDDAVKILSHVVGPVSIYETYKNFQLFKSKLAELGYKPKKSWSGLYAQNVAARAEEETS